MPLEKTVPQHVPLFPEGKVAMALGLTGALIGAPIGAPIGAIIGHRDVYVVEHEADTGTK